MSDQRWASWCEVPACGGSWKHAGVGWGGVSPELNIIWGVVYDRLIWEEMFSTLLLSHGFVLTCLCLGLLNILFPKGSSVLG